MSIWSNLLLAWSNRGKIKDVSTQVDIIREAVKSKPASGYMSSEFLTMIGGAVIMLFNTFSGGTHQLDPKLSGEIAVILIGIYGAYRTILKMFHQAMAVFHTLSLALGNKIAPPAGTTTTTTTVAGADQPPAAVTTTVTPSTPAPAAVASPTIVPSTPPPAAPPPEA